MTQRCCAESSCKKPIPFDSPSAFCCPECKVKYWGVNNMEQETNKPKQGILSIQRKCLQRAEELRKSSKETKSNNYRVFDGKVNAPLGGGSTENPNKLF